MAFLAWLLMRLPRGLRTALFAGLGRLLWVLRLRRRVVLENLRLAFPEKTEAERRAIGLATYRNLALLVPDFLCVPYLAPAELDRLFVTQGWESFEEARALGKGVIACTAHFGNFEVLSAAQNRRGVPITTISRKMSGSAAADGWLSTRTRSGLEVLFVRKGGNVLSASIRAIQSGRVLGYVFDQSQPGKRAIFPTFFGIPCATPVTPAVLARRTGAATVFALSYPLGDGRHQVIIEGPLFPPDTGDPERDNLAFMQDLNDRLERWVRLHPEHWYWLHRRWKRRGPGAASPPAPPALTSADGAG
ncbi:MAG: lysophospholipid acyltransferase family protein [Anaeromyxobacter sp.]